MIAFPNAKINIGLFIERKRPDGYHDLSTVFYPIPLSDIVEVVRGMETKLTTYGNAIACAPEKNLVMKAYRCLEADFQLPPVEISLYKHIPDGAGLGGGSSDAANVLLLLNKEFSLGLDNEALAEYAACIGADCPFFIYNKPMVARGIGNLFTQAGIRLAGYTMVLVKPQISVPTAVAYANVHPRNAKVDIEQLIAVPVSEWKNLLYNDFEDSVFRTYPELAAIKKMLYDKGATYASMSGSGSAIYALYENDNMADAAIAACQGLKTFKFSL